ncbi:MAG: hypothetical protein WC552_05790 [Candidatus Omnitrophota bacterium]
MRMAAVIFILLALSFHARAAENTAKNPAENAVRSASLDQAVREYIRREFKMARTNERNAKGLSDFIESRFSFSEGGEEVPAVVVVYYGALKGLKARASSNPLAKLNFLSESLTLLDEAVASAQDDLEVRFIRFATLHHLPAVLGVGKKRYEDVSAICRLLEGKDYSLVDRGTQSEMIDFMLKSRRLSLPARQSLAQLSEEGQAE